MYPNHRDILILLVHFPFIFACRYGYMLTCVYFHACWQILLFFPLYFFGEPGFIFIIFTSVAPHRGQPAAKCHPMWQPSRRLAVSCGLGRHRIRTRDCRTTVWRATIELPHLPLTNTLLNVICKHVWHPRGGHIAGSDGGGGVGIPWKELQFWITCWTDSGNDPWMWDLLMKKLMVESLHFK